jgi:hypothetical protein
MPDMNRATEILRVKQIVIDEEGNVAKRFPRIDQEGQLKNTLLFAKYPEICVLSMQVPGGLLDAYEQARISQTLIACATRAGSIVSLAPADRRKTVNFMPSTPRTKS